MLGDLCPISIQLAGVHHTVLELILDVSQRGSQSSVLSAKLVGGEYTDQLCLVQEANSSLFTGTTESGRYNMQPIRAIDTHWANALFVCELV